MSEKGSIRSIKPAFWLANAQEACERLAYFGIRAVLPLMMVSVGTGGLGLSMAEKGAIYGVWALIQCLVPMVSGGFSESFGYKKSLIVAFTINTLGYLLMANVLNVVTLLTGSEVLNTTWNFWVMMIAGCTIGLGTAIFKPPVQGIVAKSLNDKNSGLGFGIFYWVVNVGGFLAPMLASSLRGNEQHPTWHYVFYGAAFVTLFNLFITLLLFKDPVKEEDDADAKDAKDAVENKTEKSLLDENKNSDSDALSAPEKANEAADALMTEKTDEAEKTAKKPKKSALGVFFETLGILWNDKLMLFFLLIVSGFWLMFMQLWDLLPNFLDEWVDRRSVGMFLQNIPLIRSADWYEPNGALKPEMIINIDSAAIILFVVPLSALFARYKMITALILGMVISVIGFVMSGLSMSGGLACLAIFIFAIGEIICSPKFSEYIGMTAPKDKKAIYMGFSNIPFAVGWAVGNFLSGPLYQMFSSKLAIGRQWLLAHNVTKVPASELDINNAQQFLMNELGMAQSELPELIKTSGKSLEELQKLLSQHNLSLSSSCMDKMKEGLLKTAEDLDVCQIAEAKKLLSGQDLQHLMQVVESNKVTEVPVDYCNIDCVMSHVQTAAGSADSFAATEVLWEASNPWMVWIILGAIGVVSMVGMIGFYFKSGMAKHDDELQAQANAEDSDTESEEVEKVL